MKLSPKHLYLILSSGLLLSGSLEVIWGPTELFHWHHVMDFLQTGQAPGEHEAWLVMTQLRLPRFLLAALVGTSLGVSGALLQSYFKNPLAEPYVLGISSGAGFGAVVWSALMTTWTGVSFGGMVSSFCASLLVVAMVVGFARNGGTVFNHKLLLAGVALGMLFASLTTGILLTANTDQFRAILTWLMGSVAYRGWNEVGVLLPITLIGVGISIRMWRELDWLAIDEDAAYTSGVHVKQVKRMLLLLAVLMTSASVAVCGSVAFVGLMVPHTVRFFSGASHRHLLFQSALGGAMLVTLADLAGRMLIPGIEIPLSLLTSIVGALFFLFLLRRGIR